jgi:hypothetical protein
MRKAAFLRTPNESNLVWSGSVRVSLISQRNEQFLPGNRAGKWSIPTLASNSFITVSLQISYLATSPAEGWEGLCLFLLEAGTYLNER